MQDEWTAKNGTFPGYNCRITAMNLFGDFLSVSADSQINAGEEMCIRDRHRGTIRAYNGETGAVFEITLPMGR